MRPISFAFALFTVLAHAAPATLPDSPTITDLDEFRLSCESRETTISLLEGTGQKDKAVTMRSRLFEDYDAEMFARRCQLADYSLAALNPFLPADRRKAAADAIEPAIAGLVTLSKFAAPSPAGRARHIKLAGQSPSETQTRRSESHAALEKLRQKFAIQAIGNPNVTRLHRDLVAQLTRTAAANEPLDKVINKVRALPPSGDAYKNLAENFGGSGGVEQLFEDTGESLALEATLTATIEADPANAVFWLARARARFVLGWRAGAVVDLTIADSLTPNLPGVESLTKRIKETPVSIAAICQEWVASENASEVVRQHELAQKGGKPIVELSPALERTARAAIRNRARRLYAASFVNKADLRASSVHLIAKSNPVPAGLFPFVRPELARQYEADLSAAGNDATTHIAIQQRYAPLFGVTEGFWHRQISLLLGIRQNDAVVAATDIAGAMFVDAAWVKEARVRAAPDSRKK